MKKGFFCRLKTRLSYTCFDGVLKACGRMSVPLRATIMSAFSIPMMFAWYLRFRFVEPGKKTFGITLRLSEPTSDTEALIDYLESNLDAERIYLFVKSKSRALEFECFFRKNRNSKLVLVDTSWEAGKALGSVRSLMLQSRECMKPYFPIVFSMCKGRTVLDFGHGVVTKGSAEYKFPDNLSKIRRYAARPKLYALFGFRLRGLKVVNNGIHGYLAKGNSFTSQMIAPVGLPRFFRAKELLESRRESISGKESESMRILYAPTRESTLWDLPGMDSRKLYAALEGLGACLYVKNHPSRSGQLHDENRLKDRFFVVDPCLYKSPLDLVAEMDLVLTDRSSIMMEAIALDVPVIHLVNKSSKPEEVVLEHVFSLPGRKVDEFSSLVSALETPLADLVSEQSYAKTVWSLNPENSMSCAYSDITKQLML